MVHEGRANFSELQAELARGDQERLLYYAFDLLWFEGEDLRKERKALLKALFDAHELQAPVLYSEHLEGTGQELFEHAARLNYEGIISKKADAPYRSDRNEAWLKIKAVQRGKFPVVGFIKDPSGVAAVSRQAGRQRPGLHGESGHRLVAHGLQPDPQEARYGGQPEGEADQAGSQAQGNLG